MTFSGLTFTGRTYSRQSVTILLSFPNFGLNRLQLSRMRWLIVHFPLDQTGCELNGSQRISYLVCKSGSHLPEGGKAILQLLLFVQLLHQRQILEEQGDSINRCPHHPW